MGRAFRFRAPPATVSAELSWLLRRAFGPENHSKTKGLKLDGECLLDGGTKLELLHRVGARTPPDVLRDEVGNAAATTIAECHEHTAVQANCLLKTARDIGDVAARLAVPIIFLKGTALHFAGHTRPGLRAMGDVDFLATDQHARSLQTALLEQGYREVYEGDFSEDQQGHLPCLGSPHHQGAEAHLVMQHVHLDKDRSATAATIAKHGLMLPAPGFPERCMIPNDDLLAAHILVHGLVRHGAVPHVYPPTRVLGDIRDLGFDEHQWQAFESAALPWIEHAVSRREIRAVADTAAALASGDDPQRMAGADDDRAHFLRHLAAIVGWPGYADLIKLQHAQAQSWGTMLWPDKDRVLMELGKDSSPMRRLGWRLWRPFRITGKLIRVSAGQIGAHLTNKR